MAEAGTGGPPLISCTAIPKKLLGGLAPPLVGHWGATPYFMHRSSEEAPRGVGTPPGRSLGGHPLFHVPQVHRAPGGVGTPPGRSLGGLPLFHATQ